MKAFDINEIQLTIQSPDFVMPVEFNNSILDHIEKLGKVYGRITKIDAIIKTVSSDKNENCQMEVKIVVPGQIFYAIEKKANFQLATKSVFEDLQNQLYKYKAKLEPQNSKPAAE
ncbi:MAG TPA: HPF/RaiA family ribosome-associated protein [Bacteroidia bacterium]|nr:HPF/RaiA family ribosome-associated protein [Bacteroidia bacterium]